MKKSLFIYHRNNKGEKGDVKKKSKDSYILILIYILYKHCRAYHENVI